MAKRAEAREGEAAVITELVPPGAQIGDPSFTLQVLGTGFAAGDVIVFAGQDEPTTVVSDTEVTTGVNMDTWFGPDAIPVTVRNALGGVSNVATFTFTGEAAAPAGSYPHDGPTILASPGESNARAVRAEDAGGLSVKGGKGKDAGPAPVPEPGDSNARASRDGVVKDEDRKERVQPGPDVVHLDPGHSNAGASRDGILSRKSDPERAKRG